MNQSLNQSPRQTTSTDRPGPDEFAVIAALATDIATEAGRLLHQAVDETRTDVGTKSTGTDMVTEMDRASEALIVARIISARPDDAILGEEGAERTGRSGFRWVIDPLDGTTNYLYRLPGWNVSIGVELHGEPIAGAVVVPAYGDTFCAALGQGATRNGVPMHITASPPSMAEALIGTGFSYDSAIRTRQAEFLVDLIARVRDIRRVGAAATDLCALAAGRIDAYYETGLEPWDRCAGTIIAREAGAIVDTVDDHPLPGVLVVASHPARRDELRTLLRNAGVLP